MARSRGSSKGWLVPGVLASGGGLVVLGLVAVLTSLRAAEDEARAAARRAAETSARVLSRTLADPEVLELVADRCFDVAGEELVVPPWVGWWDAPPDEDPGRTLPADVLVHARRAHRAADTDAILVAIDAGLGVKGNDAATLAHLRLHSAWVHWRAKRKDSATRALLSAMTEVGVLRRSDVAGALLLADAAGVDVPDELWQATGRLTDDETLGLCARMGRTPERVERARERAGAYRRILAAAAARRPWRTDGPDPSWSVKDGTAILWFPSQDGAVGRGAIVPLDELLATLRSDGRIDRAEVLASQGAPDGAVPVGVGLFIVPESAPQAPWLQRFGLPLGLAGLMVVMIAGLWVSVRALGRETAAARTRAEFLTSVTHELKTPLASIRLISEMLEDGRVPDDRRPTYAALLVSETARLGALVENVLDLGRMERGERSYDRRRWPVGEVVHDAVELFAPVAARDGLSVRGPASLPEGDAFVDRDAVMQALMNVMDNARKYAVAGDTLEVDAERVNGHVVVRLRDHGPGIPADERESVFERFSRGQAEADGKVPGVGLGLYLSRAIVRDQGGDLACEEPSDGVGACFRLVLPVMETA